MGTAAETLLGEHTLMQMSPLPAPPAQQARTSTYACCPWALGTLGWDMGGHLHTAPSPPVPPAPHLTSYFLLLTSYIHLDLNAKRARAGAVSRARAPTDDPDPTGPWGSSVRELRPAIRPWGCEHSWHPLGYISIWPVYLILKGVCGTPSLGSVETWH